MDDYLSKRFEQLRSAYRQREIKMAIPNMYHYIQAGINCRCITEEKEVVIDYNKIYKMLKANE